MVMPNDHSKQDQHNHKKELKQCDRTNKNKEDQVYYDSNSNDDTFHNATQVEDVIKDTYDDNDYVNRKPINNVIDDTDDDDNNNWKPFNNKFLQPAGKGKGATGMMYENERVLYVQYSIPDLLDHLNSISSMPNPY